MSNVTVTNTKLGDISRENTKTTIILMLISE